MGPIPPPMAARTGHVGLAGVGLSGPTAPRQGRGSMALRGINLVTWSAHYRLLRYPFPKLRSKWFYTS
jgi:hypothetical protein